MCHQQPNTPQAEAHSYTQGCRLHNTSASWNGSQYYWLTQDTGSSQRSSRKAPVPSLLASVFICLSFKPIAQQAASDFSQIFILLDRRDTKSITHTHTKQSLRTQKEHTATLLHMWYENKPGISQPCHTLDTPDTLTHARAHQKLPACARDAECEKQLKKMWNRRGVTLTKL